MIEKILKKHLGDFKIVNFCCYSPTYGTYLRNLTVYHIIDGKSYHCIKYETFRGWKALKRPALKRVDIYEETVKELKQIDYEQTCDELEQIESNLN